MRTTSIEKAIIDQNMVFGLAKKTPIFIIDGRLYYCTRNKASPNFFKPKNNDDYYGIVEGPRISVLEKLFNKKLEKDFSDYQKDFLEKELKNQDMYEDGKLSKNTSESKKLIMFAVKEIFPYLRKDNSKSLDNILNTEIEEPGPKENTEVNKTREKEINNYINERINKLKKDSKNNSKFSIRQIKRNKLDEIFFGEPLPEIRRDDSLLGKIIGSSNIEIDGNYVYLLKDTKRNADLEIKGKKYSINTNPHYLKDLKADFSLNIINKLSIDALKNNLKESEVYQKLKNQSNDLDEICKKSKYHEKDFGFETLNKNLKLQLDIPEHVLESPHNHNLYRFKAHKIEITIGFQEIDYDPGFKNKKIMLTKGPYGVGNESGPFYSSSGSLCMGLYSWENRKKGMTLGKSLAMLLIDARKVVLSGYTSTHITPHKELTEDYFSHKKISRKEVRRKNLPITNIKFDSKESGRYENDW